MHTYTIVCRNDESSKEIASKLDSSLQKENMIRDDDNPSVVFVVGGDGSFLRAVHKYIDKLESIKFYGLHTGTLGFFTDYNDSDYEIFLSKYLNNELEEMSYPLLKIEMGNKVYYALNEMRIENVVRTQILNISIDDEMFEDFRGTGVCVATQIGSTAYNRSLGGAVIVEGMNAIEMSEIAGIHHSKYRSLGAPIVMNGNTKLKFASKDFKGAILGIDSEVYPIQDINEIKVEISNSKKVNMLRGRNVSYFKRLKSLF